MEPSRIDCPHAVACGACRLIGAPLETQRELKQERVQRAIAPYHGSDVQPEPLRTTLEVMGYRTRAKLVVSQRGALGLYAPQSHRVVDLPGCRVLRPSLAKVAARLREAFGGDRLTIPTLRLHGIDLREVQDPAAGAFRVLVTLIVQQSEDTLRPGAGGDVEAAAALIAAWPEVTSVAVSERPLGAPQLLGRNLRVLQGPQAVRDGDLEAGEPWCFASHGSFVQAHRGQAAAVYAEVTGSIERHLGDLEAATVLELYAGSGALGLRLAMRGATVTMVEAHAPAAKLAADAAEAQQLEVVVRTADAAEALGTFVRQGKRFDAIIMNPPRSGLHPAVRSLLPDLQPQVLAYIACDPDTLARDLYHLQWLGMRTRRIVPFDMLPLSADVESVALMTSGSPAAPTVLYQDEEVLIVDKPPHLPTTPQGEHSGSLLALVRTAFAAPEATPVHRLDLGTSGACIFARTPAHVQRWADRLARGHKRYLALVRGVPRAKGTVRRPLPERGRTQGRGKASDATTRYRRLQVLSGHALLSVAPEQGRTHQIRRHLATLGHPVLGDARYGDRRSNLHFERKHGLDRSFLHCARLVLPFEDDRPPLVIESPLAPDLAKVLSNLRIPRGERSVQGSETPESLDLGSPRPSHATVPEMRGFLRGEEGS